MEMACGSTDYLSCQQGKQSRSLLFIIIIIIIIIIVVVIIIGISDTRGFFRGGLNYSRESVLARTGGEEGLWAVIVAMVYRAVVWVRWAAKVPWLTVLRGWIKQESK